MLNLDKAKNVQELSDTSKKRRANKGKFMINENSSKKRKVHRDDGDLELLEPNSPISDQNSSNSDEAKEIRVPLEDKPKKSKRKNKKKNSKSSGDGTDINLACLAYLSQWKNNKESWKFEKIKQIRLSANAFDKDKLPDEYFDVFLEYMEKASESMKKLLMTRASELILNVEKWNDLSDKEKLTSAKPKSYEGYERARDFIQRFE